jgi:quercetin dioxygenase-like cupin family protein
MKYKKLSSVDQDIRQDYIKRVIFNTSELPGEGHMMQEVTIPPHTRQRAHYHIQQTEIFYILEGEAEIHINEALFQAVPGDAFVCSPGERHFIYNHTSRDFSLLVMKIDRPADSEDSVWTEK